MFPITEVQLSLNRLISMTAEVHLATVTTSRRSPTIRACDLRVRLVLYRVMHAWQVDARWSVHEGRL